jgi:hypothetical protein
MVRKHAILALGTSPFLEEATRRVVNAAATVTSFTLAQKMHSANLCLPISRSRSLTIAAFTFSIRRLRTTARFASVALAAPFSVSVSTGALGLIFALAFLSIALFLSFSHS